MTGELDPRYVKARSALLEALEVLEPHLSSLTLVGAQAIYLHVGEVAFAAAPFTLDADLGIDPRSLADFPPLEKTLLQHGFRPGLNPGAWIGPNGAEVDLLVAESLAGRGSRSAEVGEPHGERTARRSDGLEATLVDFDISNIPSLEPEKDDRSFRLRVAGPGGLLVAKLRKIGERFEKAAARPGPRTEARLKEKDALDVYRILLLKPGVLAGRIQKTLREDLSRSATKKSLGHLRELFSAPDAYGCRLLQGAVEVLTSPAARGPQPALEVRQCAALANELLKAVGGPEQ